MWDYPSAKPQAEIRMRPVLNGKKIPHSFEARETMADTAAAVTCPECDKKFKPKSDVRGKKIKCPFCKEAFTVPAEKKSKAGAAKPKKQEEEEPISLVDEVKPP